MATAQLLPQKADWPEQKEPTEREELGVDETASEDWPCDDNLSARRCATWNLVVLTAVAVVLVVVALVAVLLA